MPGPSDDMVALPGGRFRMGSDRHYAEEAPVRWQEVAPFRIDRTPVTNRAFAAFVQANNLFRAEPVAVEHFTLFSSQLGKEQSVYTAEVEYELS